MSTCSQTDLFAVEENEASPKPARNPVLSEKQRIILDWLQENDTLDMDTAVNLVGGDIYHNERKHVGALISRMVDRGLLYRIKLGLYRLP